MGNTFWLNRRRYAVSLRFLSRKHPQFKGPTVQNPLGRPYTGADLAPARSQLRGQRLEFADHLHAKYRWMRLFSDEALTVGGHATRSIELVRQEGDALRSDDAE